MRKPIAFTIMSAVFAMSAFATEGGLKLRFSKSVDPSVRVRMADDLKFLENVKGSDGTQLYREIFGTSTLDGKTLVHFFTSRVDRVMMDSCGGGIGPLACVNPEMGWSTMALTTNYVNANAPAIFRIGVILHESRHTEKQNGGWDHIKCPTPFLDSQGKEVRGIVSNSKLEGTYSCDPTVYGAYGMETVFYKNVEKFCSTCSEKVRMDARIYGDDNIKRVVGRRASREIRDDLK